MSDSEFLTQIANKVMQEKGLSVDFPVSALQQLEKINEPENFDLNAMEDLREWPWCSIDNDDSRDLDQLTYARQLETGEYIAYIAIADVDTLVTKMSPIDRHAQINTTSIYTPSKIYPMLPEKLSTDLTSLNENKTRVSVIFEIKFNRDMGVISSRIYIALVKNYAQLAYSKVGPWLEGHQAAPEKIGSIPGLTETLLLQNELAQSLKKTRQELGSLTLETIETKAIFAKGKVVKLAPTQRNQAHELIENFMIAANTASARYLIEKNLPGLRRVVRVPARWDRIVEIAKSYGEDLPLEPDSQALDFFLKKQKMLKPETFPDLSLTIIKLLGSGEYVVEIPGDDSIGHFGLGLRDYTHSTAPNRRYPDLMTQRQIKASINGLKSPYTLPELESLAGQCTRSEDLAAKVERHLKKSAAAMLLSDHLGEKFEALVTGASDKGTWVRLIPLPIEGKLVQGFQELDIGDKITVKLINIDIPQGFIDFSRSFP